MQDIDVTIVIPTYNRANLLIKTLNSLFEQTYLAERYEIIVCDDNSKDNTEEVVQNIIKKTKHNLKYIKVKSDMKGPAKVRNSGIRNSSGTIIGFTDDDCVVSKKWIETAVKFFEEHNDICGVSGIVITEGNCKNNKFKIPQKMNILHGDRSYVAANIFYKKQVLLDVGCFDEEMRYLEDIELGWRVEEIGKIMFSPELLVKHHLFCLSIPDYLRKQRFVEYWVLMHSKHPEHKKRDNLIFNCINHRRTFYTFFLIMTILFGSLNKNIFYLFLILTITSYLWSHVVIDTKFSRYPLRVLKFPIHVTLDLFRFIYSVKGSIRAKIIMFY